MAIAVRRWSIVDRQYTVEQGVRVVEIAASERQYGRDQ